MDIRADLLNLMIDQKQPTLQVVFLALVREYRTMSPSSPPAPSDSALHESIDKLIKQGEARRLSWLELYDFESMVMRLRDDLSLRRSAWSIRREVQQLASEQLWNDYLASKPPDPADPNVPTEEIRHDIEELLRKLHELRIGRSHLELIRGYTTAVTISICTLLVIIAIGDVHCTATRMNAESKAKITPNQSVSSTTKPSMSEGKLAPMTSNALTAPTSEPSTQPALAESTKPTTQPFAAATQPAPLDTDGQPTTSMVDDYPKLLYLAMVAGIFGAAFSMLIRLGQIPTKGDLIARYPSKSRILIWLLTPFASLVEGTIAALVLYFLLRSELITGSLFPTFVDWPAGRGRHVDAWLILARAVSAVDAAKLVVWCFVAGFSERLVPDMLSRLADQAAKSSPSNTAK